MPGPIMSMLTARYESRFEDENGGFCPLPIGYVVLAFGDADVAAWPIPAEEMPEVTDNHLQFVERFAAARLRSIFFDA
ncbi:hypothetical protein [Actinoplanes xinjiangensis]|uniref:hypothetical protein n=1 Tax=Actinoplanes xinjiangensis TaxID=512350 RepID=UPI00341C7619